MNRQRTASTSAASRVAPAPTPQQRDIIALRGVSISVSAGAGCGKTSVLTARYLDELRQRASAGADAKHARRGARQDHDPLSGIVAITFTERAAAEMRDRVRLACHQELAKCADEWIDYWTGVIRGLDAARISTIHAFCASLLRAHAVDAGIDPRFGILEGTEADTFLHGVVRDGLFDALGAGDANAAELILEYGVDRTADMLKRLVRDRFRGDFKAFLAQSPRALADRHWALFRSDGLKQLLTTLRETRPTRRVLDLLSRHESSHPVMIERREVLLAGLPRIGASGDPIAEIARLRAVAQVQGGGGKNAWDSEDIYEQIKDALAKLREEFKKISDLGEIKDAHVEEAARLGLAAINVARGVVDRYEQAKQQAGMLDFDDLLLRTRDLLAGSAEVRRRAAAGIDFLMVDEFQDTDPVQCEIVRRLCGEELGNGKLFLVGDVKQSIYRFRRADPRVFVALRNELPVNGHLPLSTNFRSQPAMLDFVNCLFARAMGDVDPSDTPDPDAEYKYEPYTPLRPHDETQYSPVPSIEFLFAPAPVSSETDESDAEDAAGDDDDDADATVSGDGDRADDRRKREADWIARRIVALIEDDTPRIRDKDPRTGAVALRAVEPRDIAILFRSLSNVALYEEALRRYGLPYYLVGGKAFYSQQEVFDVINLCRFLNDPADLVSLAGILRSPFFSVSDDALFAMVDAGGTLAAGLRLPPADWLDEHDRRQWGFAAAVLDELSRLKDRLPLATLLNHAVLRTGYDASLLHEFLGRRKAANLGKLLDMARGFDAAGLGTLDDFVRMMRESIVRETDEEQAAAEPEAGDVVRLMTVHQAKGLEFPIVIVADMEWRPPNDRQTSARFDPMLGPLVQLNPKAGEKRPNLAWKVFQALDAPQSEAEAVRLLYVACTRAQDHLILSAGVRADRQGRSHWMKLLAGCFDLTSGLPVRDPYLGRLAFGDVDPRRIPQIRVHHHPPEISGTKHHDAEAELSLEQFEASIAAAEPAPLPTTLAVIPPRADRLQLSVSAIERMIESEQTFGPAAGAAGESAGEAGDGTDLGTFVHRALELLDLAQPGDVEALTRRVLAATKFAADAQMHTAVARRLRAFCRAPVRAELAAAQQCFREAEFLLRWPVAGLGLPVDAHDERQPKAFGSVTITGTIDCLYQTEQGRWRIVDYKTGRFAGTTPDDVLRRYQTQLVLYALAARAATGKRPAGATLVLVGDEDAISVELTLTDALEQSVARRVDEAIATLAGAHP